MELPLEFRPLAEIIYSIKTEEISSFSFLESLLRRIERLDHKINSYARMNPNALEECRKKEKLSEYLIPVSIKDLFNTKNIETNYGSKIFAGNFPKRDASIVSNIKKKGE